MKLKCVAMDWILKNTQGLFNLSQIVILIYYLNFILAVPATSSAWNLTIYYCTLF